MIQTYELIKAADIAILQCMGLQSDETALVVVDPPQRELGLLLAESCRNAGAETIFIEINQRGNHGEEPPPAVAAAMLKADVILLPTSKSLSHTEARRRASDAGARIASMPMITTGVMARTMVADYQVIEERNQRLFELLAGGQQARLTSAAGTDLTFSIAGRPFHLDGGLNTKPGDFANLPAGELYCAPVEGTAEGVIIVDGSMAAIGLLNEPLQLTVKKGLVTEISGGEEAEQLEAIIAPYGRAARNIAELGIGTNDRAIITGNILEDEKVLGTCHIAIGDNSTFGGTVSVASHLDGILRNPNLEIDGKLLLEKGIPQGWL
ncbi:aminopeptidase [bacterium]|nr:aminopeptidase [bacterium]